MYNYAYFHSSIASFLAAEQEKVLGVLSHSHNFALDIPQKNAWVEQIIHLKEQLEGLERGQIFFEFSIPRMGKRVDVILFIKDVVFVLEYKTGAQTHERYARDQVLDYALDLKNFHEGSHHKHIVPILIATEAPRASSLEVIWDTDKVAVPILCSSGDLSKTIANVLSSLGKSDPKREPAYGFPDNNQEEIATNRWADSGYKPTPTIIEAAQALYRGHNVAEISRSDAGAQNLTLTSNCISEIISYSKANRRKSICFVTGVPGAGKTLAGLNISTQKLDPSSEEHAVFLSGNGPLVTVLREALARDEAERSKKSVQCITKKDALRSVGAFIQNIHHFRDYHLNPEIIPDDHVVIFDEAQRAWDRHHAEKFMIQKKGQKFFDMSEPEFLIGVMDRRPDWATIVCLIGGGQEINTGEAGLIEWFNALQKRFQNWDVYHSGQLSHKAYSWGEDLNSKISTLHATEKKELHLSVSIRSFRAEKLSEFVSAIIDGDASAAREIKKHLQNYRLAVTRDINAARTWLRQHARGSERLGLIASSGAIRLRPEGIHIKSNIDPANWFLNGKEDIRSSYYLEEVATEFDIQGLELDWTGICWDADFRREENQWMYYDFKGTKWQNINDRYRRVYLANAYRVLLTRARQGMVIFIPNGDVQDYTRPPKFYDETYDFLKSCDIRNI
jgi:hypothetical protein